MQEGLEPRHVLSRSACLSADVNAAFDPTFASAYEANNASFLNNGVVVTKYTGSGGKGGTSDASAEFMGRIRSLLDKKKVLWQVGELGKVDGGGGRYRGQIHCQYECRCGGCRRTRAFHARAL